MANVLTVETPDKQMQTLTLDRDCYHVGRSAGNDLCFSQIAGLSREHRSSNATERSGLCAISGARTVLS